MASRAVDTHAHLFLREFEGQWEAVTHRAQQVCQAVLLPNLDTASLPALLALWKTAPDFYYGMVGLHPTHVREGFREELAQLEKTLDAQPWVAIGEVGLDLYWDPSTRSWQEEALHVQATWAQQRGLPLSIHFRQALDETLAVLRPFVGQVEGVFHCFTGGYEEAERILDAGFHLGLGGVITYRSAQPLREAIRRLPLDKLVLETDSPYLAPVPLRGRRNESAYLTYIVKAIAELRGLPEAAVVEVTTETAARLFRLPLVGRT